MGRLSSRDNSLHLSIIKQQAFHPLLVAARKTKLASAVSVAAAECDAQQLRQQVVSLANPKLLALAAAAGIRDEHVIATPCLLKQKPSAIAYYRLLLGISRKQFYKGGTGFGLLKAMEDANNFTEKYTEALDLACIRLNELIVELILPLDVHFTLEDIRDLPLLQLGAQFDGANRVKIGKAAATEVFSAIVELLRNKLRHVTAKRLELLDATGVEIVIVCASDPDIQIVRQDGSQRPRRIAIEIKGGTDLSNANNRAGEAEKSHLKAKADGATEFWTVASLPKLRLDEFKSQSPTTNNWFDLSEVLGRDGPSWIEFRQQIASAVGINLV